MSAVHLHRDLLVVLRQVPVHGTAGGSWKHRPFDPTDYCPEDQIDPKGRYTLLTNYTTLEAARQLRELVFWECSAELPCWPEPLHDSPGHPIRTPVCDNCFASFEAGIVALCAGGGSPTFRDFLAYQQDIISSVMRMDPADISFDPGGKGLTQ